MKLLVVLPMVNFRFSILSLRIWLLYEKSFVISINPKCVWLDKTIDYWGLVAFLNSPTDKIFGNLFDVRYAWTPLTKPRIGKNRSKFVSSLCVWFLVWVEIDSFWMYFVGPFHCLEERAIKVAFWSVYVYVYMYIYTLTKAIPTFSLCPRTHPRA